MSSNHLPYSSIHLGNYEEFFLLYVDGELSPEQAEAVDAFVAANPDLRAELDLLNSTRLTPETLSFPKEELLSHNMESVISEELFLYMDKELSAEDKAAVEQALDSRPAYRLQLDELLRTRLDASETVAYPDKKELYRREERRIAFPWLRVAAAVAVVALGGLIYFNRPSANSGSLTGTTGRTTNRPKAAEQINTIAPAAGVGEQHLTASTKGTPIKAAPSSLPGIPPHKEEVVLNKNKQQKIAAGDNDLTQAKTPVDHPSANDVHPKQLLASIGNSGQSGLTADAIKPAIAAASGLNNSPVTFALQERTTTNEAATKGAISFADVAVRNEHKGSVKGFLRKATRLIEKRTGVDPTNDGELLIGVVAVKLK